MAGFRVLDGVRHQVDQNLAQALAVGVDVRRKMARPVVLEGDPFSGSL